MNATIHYGETFNVIETSDGGMMVEYHGTDDNPGYSIEVLPPEGPLDFSENLIHTLEV